MPQYIAFLRAINVSGRMVKMEILRRLFTDMGLEQVETFIASGNVIFTAPADPVPLETALAAMLQPALGYPVATFIRLVGEVAVIAGNTPFPAEGGALHIAFLGRPPDEAGVHKLQTYTTAIDEFQVQGREVYWHCRTRVSGSSFSGAVLEKVLGQPATLRSITTVKKLAAKYG